MDSTHAVEKDGIMPTCRLLHHSLMPLLLLSGLGCAGDATDPPPPAELPLLLVVIPDLATSQQSDLYTLSPSGDSLHRVTNTPTWEVGPTWSPDGKFIAYQLLPPSGLITLAEIHLMRADGTADRRLAGPGTLGPPAWSPDGSSLAFDQAPFPDSAQRVLLLVRADGSGLDTVLNRRAADASPAWSPDGASLAFTSNCLANSPACWATTLWIVRLADTGLRQLTFPDPLDSLGQDDAGLPRWSPDGTLLAFQHGAWSAIALVPAAGGSLIPVNTGPVQGWSPAWSPTGSALAFVAGPPSGPAVWLAAGDGSNPRPFTSIPGILRTVHWRP